MVETRDRTLNFGSMSLTEFNAYLAKEAQTLAKDRGETVDRIRKKIAFDFFLRRLISRAPGTYVLKGGYAIEVRFHVVRATKDIDLVVSRSSTGEASERHMPTAEQIRQNLVDHLAEPAGTDDRFVAFRLDPASSLIRGGGGGIQQSARMLIGTQKFTEFSIDLSLADIEHPIKRMQVLRPVIDGFAKEITCEILGDEQIWAEKLHAYLRQGDGFVARTKDFADLVLIGQRGFDFALCHRLIDEVFNYWLEDKATLTSLPLPPRTGDLLPHPPAAWRQAYARIAQDLGIPEDIDVAYEFVSGVFEKVIATQFANYP